MTDVTNQLKQFNKLIATYRADIKALNTLIENWDSDETNVDEFVQEIKNNVKNADEISISLNEKNQYLVEFVFKPITVALIVENDQKA